MKRITMNLSQILAILLGSVIFSILFQDITFFLAGIIFSGFLLLGMFFLPPYLVEEGVEE